MNELSEKDKDKDEPSLMLVRWKPEKLTKVRI